MLNIENISGIENFTTKSYGEHDEDTLYLAPNEKAFLVIRKNTLEVRCDNRLSRTLAEKYESVMMSRYFGNGGIEIVPSGQLEESELEDLIRLSYNLTIAEE